jgi:hypothetical protein
MLNRSDPVVREEPTTVQDIRFQTAHTESELTSPAMTMASAIDAQAHEQQPSMPRPNLQETPAAPTPSSLALTLMEFLAAATSHVHAVLPTPGDHARSCSIYLHGADNRPL